MKRKEEQHWPEVPRFWWDFHRTEKAIIVESIEYGCPVVAAFEYEDNPNEAIARAEAVIDDLNQYKVKPIVLARRVPDRYRWNIPKDLAKRWK